MSYPVARAKHRFEKWSISTSKRGKRFFLSFSFVLLWFSAVVSLFFFLYFLFSLSLSLFQFFHSYSNFKFGPTDVAAKSKDSKPDNGQEPLHMKCVPMFVVQQRVMPWRWGLLAIWQHVWLMDRHLKPLWPSVGFGSTLENTRWSSIFALAQYNRILHVTICSLLTRCANKGRRRWRYCPISITIVIIIFSPNFMFSSWIMHV